MLTIRHTETEGTLCEGTRKGDGSAAVLGALGFRRGGRHLEAWYVRGTAGFPPATARIDAMAERLRAAGFVVAVDLDGPARTDGPLTTRERREARAERLRDWADKRAAAAAALHARNEPYVGDIAFNTQPGHIPERARAIRRTERAWEHTQKADDMARRADTIEEQAAGAIYSDDVDAIPRLRARIAELEAERERIKRYNASCRRGQRDLSLLDERQRADLLSLAEHSAYQLRDGGQMPAYVSANLSGNIARQRARLAELARRAGVDEEPADPGPEPEPDTPAPAKPTQWGPHNFRPGDEVRAADGRWLHVHRVDGLYLEVDVPGCVRRERLPYATVTGRRRPPSVALAIEERREQLAAPAPPVCVSAGPGGQLALAL